jgi:hypothetical protein
MDGRELIYVLVACYTRTQLRMLNCLHLNTEEKAPWSLVLKPLLLNQWTSSSRKRRHSLRQSQEEKHIFIRRWSQTGGQKEEK